jgi:hypothetical protein
MTPVIETNESSNSNFLLLMSFLAILTIILYKIYHKTKSQISLDTNQQDNNICAFDEISEQTFILNSTDSCSSEILTLDDNQKYNIGAPTIISHQCNNDIDSVSIATDQCDSDNQQCTPFKLPMTLNRNNPEFYQAFIQKLSNRTLTSQCPRSNIRPVLLKCHQYKRKL